MIWSELLCKTNSATKMHLRIQGHFCLFILSILISHYTVVVPANSAHMWSEIHSWNRLPNSSVYPRQHVVTSTHMLSLVLRVILDRIHNKTKLGNGGVTQPFRSMTHILQHKNPTAHQKNKNVKKDNIYIYSQFTDSVCRTWACLVEHSRSWRKTDTKWILSIFWFL